jgi:hypothetical protein
MYTNIYSFLNALYFYYGITVLKQGSNLILPYREDISNNVRRAIGEEITDFLRIEKNKKYTFFQYHNSFKQY